MATTYTYLECCERNAYLKPASVTPCVQLVPAALQVAMSEDIEFRRALPLDYLDYMGVVNADTVSGGSNSFVVSTVIVFVVGRDAVSSICGWIALSISNINPESSLFCCV